VILKELAKDKRGLLNINYIFGEGAGARLRQIRRGVNALGLEPNDILNHANPRIIYTCRLLPNATDILTGFEEQKFPHYIPTVNQITKGWIERWLINRTKREETL
jgi:hypothetical protein